MIRLAWDPSEQSAVVAQSPDGPLAIDDGLETAVIISLGTDATALPEDVLPDHLDDDRRGWWGDHEGDVIWADPEQTGGRQWLLRRSKLTNATPSEAEQYLREALAWMLQGDRPLATSVDVTVERVEADRLMASITVRRDRRLIVDLRFDDLWSFVRS